MSLLEMFHEGGFIMYPLLIALVGVVYVVIDRVWLLIALKRDTKKIEGELESLTKDGIKSFIEKIAALNGLVGKPYFELLSNITHTEVQLKETAERLVAELSKKLSSPLWIIASVASSAPFIGLFGTVVGIIKSFDDIAQAGKGGFAVVAAGLSEALIATAAGIIVAVIAVLFFNYIKNNTSTYIADYSFKLVETIEKIKRS